MAKLAFFKGNRGTIWDKFICLVTGSQFSHVELIYEEKASVYRCWSSSTYDRGVRQKWIYLDDSWVIISIPNQVSEQVFLQEKGKSYDYLGLIGTIIPIPLFSRQRKWFCSEIIAEVLGLENSWKYTPEDLYQIYK